MHQQRQPGITLALAVLVAVFLLFAYLALRQKQIMLSVILEHPPLTAPLKILSEGREVKTLIPPPLFAGAGADQTTFEVPGRTQRRYGSDMLPSITVQVLSPCGWTDLRTRVAEVPTVQDMERAAGKPGVARMRATAFTGREIPLVWIAVDNRGGSQHEVSLGSVARMIPPNSAGVSTWWAPECEGGAPVKLDGQVIGSVPKREEWSSQRSVDCDNAPIGSLARAACSSAFLIDTSGNRCYRVRELTYGPHSPYFGGTESASFSASRFRRLPGLDYFLENAPAGVSVPFAMAGAYTSRTEVTEARCP